MSDGKPDGKSLVKQAGTEVSADQDILTNALTLLTAEQKSGLAEKATEEALKLRAFAQEAALKEDYSRREALDHIDQFGSLSKDGRLTRHVMKSEMRTATGKRTIESKSGATCFVATACFEDPDHPAVVDLRAYRDQVLRCSPRGRAFIAWYYRHGPALADGVRPHAGLRRLVRALLRPLAWLARRRVQRLSA